MRAALRPLLCMPLLAAACYAPSPPGGSYRCGEEDACPSNLHCKCNQCVSDDRQAACSFRISVDKSPLLVREHAAFPITVDAFDETGGSAGGFTGEVSLSASWGDVCVGARDCLKAPKTVHLANGTGAAMVSLNRETIPPQTAVLFADYAGRRGSSESARINVAPTPFTRDLRPVVPRVSETETFGPVDVHASAAQVEHVDGQYRMYFHALSTVFANGSAIALATSSDGIRFDPSSVKEVFHQPQPGNQNAISNPSLLTLPSGERGIFYALGDTVATKGLGTGQIGLALSPDGLAAFVDQGVLLHNTDCPFCDLAFQTGSVIADPFPELSGNGALGGWIGFFTGVATPPSGDIPTISIGRAISNDGTHFTIDSDPLLTNARQFLAGELLLLSPRVLLDGTVLKMWYSYAVLPPTTAMVLDPCAGALAQAGRIEIGYATSQDGYFWTRSPFRKPGVTTDMPGNPVLSTTLDPAAYDGGAVSLLASSVIPTDGVDPSNGIALYYTAFFQQTFSANQKLKLGMQGFLLGDGGCASNGVGRATRP